MPAPATPGRPTALGLRITTLARPLITLLFRPTVTGWEHLPAEGPYLLVANHSAGVALAEIASIAVLWTERFGQARPLAGFAHHIGFKLRPLAAVHRQFGTIPSTYEAAAAALAAGVPVLLFPGGDHESLRPIWQANRVDLAGRRGFLRVARAAGVPIVPMGIRGSHMTVPMLLRSRPLARLLILPHLLGLKRWGISLLGVLVSLTIAAQPWPLPLRLVLIWIALGTPLFFTPILPWTIRFRIGAPVPLEQLAEAAAPGDPDPLALVQSRIQSLVDAPRKEPAPD